MARRQSFDAILDRLEAQHPNAWTELHFTNAFELLVATILSAQCTDARVNQVTPIVFAKYPTPADLARATPEDLEPIVQPTGFFRVKARSLIGMAQQVVAQHGGEIPSDMDALTALPGVGRKTANVVRGHAFGIPGLPVDRHVLRVANRLGLIHTDDAVAAETALGAGLTPDRWTRASDTLILHGRRVCRPKPMCDSCQVRLDCEYFRNLGAKTRPVKKALSVKKTRKAKA
jgi:endonuclease-3